jgi:hypothetical protein
MWAPAARRAALAGASCGPARAAARAVQRQYHVSAMPTVSVEAIESMHALGARARRPADLPLRLNEYERSALNAAKRAGFLETGQHATPALCNAYYAYCWHGRRPYIAMRREGDAVAVDATPVMGLGKAQRAAGNAALERLLGRWAATAATLQASGGGPGGRRAIQIANASTLRSQAEKTLPGPMEGSNGGRPADTRPSDTFTLHAAGRAESRAAAAALFADFNELLAGSLPGTAKLTSGPEAAMQAAAGRSANTQRLLLRRLRRLVADPEAVRTLRVAGGALEGFMRADAATAAGAGGAAADSARTAQGARLN